MSREEVDAYLNALDEPKRGTLQTVRETILALVPDAEQVISYRVPAFRVQGGIFAGLAAFRAHLSYLPFSGSVLGRLESQLQGYTMTKSALHFAVDTPLPERTVEALITARLEEIRQRDAENCAAQPAHDRLWPDRSARGLEHEYRDQALGPPLVVGVRCIGRHRALPPDGALRTIELTGHIIPAPRPVPDLHPRIRAEVRHPGGVLRSPTL